MNWNVLFGLLGGVFLYWLNGLFGIIPEIDPVINFILFFLLSYPWKIKENIYSLFGGVNPDGSIYSLFSVLQIANKTAFAIFSIGLGQLAEQKNATAFFSCAAVQLSPYGTGYTFGGFVFLQKTKLGFAEIVFGVCLIQEGYYHADIFLGFCMYQFGKYNANLCMGCVVMQESDSSSRVNCGLSIIQSGDEKARMTLGFVFVQLARKEAEIGAGFCILQRSKLRKASIGAGLVGLQMGREIETGTLSIPVVQHVIGDSVSTA